MTTRRHGVTLKAMAATQLVHRPPKPVKSIGRDKARCYCQICGLKKHACACRKETP